MQGDRVIFWQVVWKDGKCLKPTCEVCANACGTHLYTHTQLYTWVKYTYMHTHIFMHINVQILAKK